MTDDHQQGEWSKLVGAARKAGAGREAPVASPPPPGFVARMRSVREGLWKMARILFWRRWSLVAVLLALLLYLGCYFFLKSKAAPSIQSPEPPTLPVP